MSRLPRAAWLCLRIAAMTTALLAIASVSCHASLTLTGGIKSGFGSGMNITYCGNAELGGNPAPEMRLSLMPMTRVDGRDSAGSHLGCNFHGNAPMRRVLSLLVRDRFQARVRPAAGVLPVRVARQASPCDRDR